jgi:hypothetical protein
MTPLLPTLSVPNTLSLGHRADYAAVGHPLWWCAAGWIHTLRYRTSATAPIAEGSVIFPTDVFMADDLPSSFLSGDTTIVEVDDAEFTADILIAEFGKPPYKDFRNDFRVFNAKTHDLYPIMGVSDFTNALTWLANPTDVIGGSNLLPHRVKFPPAIRGTDGT